MRRASREGLLRRRLSPIRTAVGPCLRHPEPRRALVRVRRAPLQSSCPGAIEPQAVRPREPHSGHGREWVRRIRPHGPTGRSTSAAVAGAVVRSSPGCLGSRSGRDFARTGDEGTGVVTARRWHANECCFSDFVGTSPRPLQPSRRGVAHRGVGLFDPRTSWRRQKQGRRLALAR